MKIDREKNPVAYAREANSDWKERNCLKCNDTFMSENAYNRVCKNCSLANKAIKEPNTRFHKI